MLNVVELFYSIQGEGSQVGVPSIFIRLHGCNLSCTFCDEERHKGTYTSFSFDEILSNIKAYPSHNVIITGGEPTLYDLNGFIEFLQAHMYSVAVETNGHNFSNISNANWVTYSPKDWNHIEKHGYDEVKFVLSSEADFHYARDMVLRQGLDILLPVLFSPVRDRFDAVLLAQLLLEQRLHVRLQLQLHSLLWPGQMRGV